jgi:hypothetical protein
MTTVGSSGKGARSHGFATGDPAKTRTSVASPGSEGVKSTCQRVGVLPCMPLPPTVCMVLRRSVATPQPPGDLMGFSGSKAEVPRRVKQPSHTSKASRLSSHGQSGSATLSATVPSIPPRLLLPWLRHTRTLLPAGPPAWGIEEDARGSHPLRARSSQASSSSGSKRSRWPHFD